MGLAEPKRKQRIVADPNNLKWADDKGGFGFKMLQKMGWSEGSGLGANLDGTVEHVKVTLKSDSAGLGVTKRDLVEDTYGHTKNFDDLLKSLAVASDKKSKKDKTDKIKNEKRLTEKQEKIAKLDEKQKKERQKKQRDKPKQVETKKVSRPHKRKFVQSKNVANYSDAQLKEIFGV